MAVVGNLNRDSRVIRRSIVRHGDVSLWGGRIAAGASFVFIAAIIFGL